MTDMLVLIEICASTVHNEMFLNINMYSLYSTYLWNFYFHDLKQRFTKKIEWDE